MSPPDNGRLYRFAPRDRSGWILGLGGAQCLALGSAILAAGTLLTAGAPAPVVIAPLGVGLLFAFARLGGRPLHEVAPVALVWALDRRRHSWVARVPLLTGRPTDDEGQPDLPPCLEGLAILAAPGRSTNHAPLGVVTDEPNAALSAILRVRGRGFALLDHAEQERMVANWGDALGGFCKERSAVRRVSWSEWVAPSGIGEHLAYFESHRAAPLDAPAVQAYLSLLEDAGPMATTHEVLVTVTVDARRAGRGRGGGDPQDRHGRSRENQQRAAIDVLVEELGLLASRLEAAGLAVDEPLSPTEIAAAVRVRLDPHATRLAARRRSLAELAGKVSVYNAGPLSTRCERRFFEADGALHASFLVTEWPRLDVPPNWMETLLLHAGAVRTICVSYEPVPPSRSARQVARDATRLASDAELRERKGFRVNAAHRRAEAAVAEREAELVAGYPELGHVGIITVTAADREALEQACRDYEQVAAQAMLELRRLDDQHDLAFAATLGLGRCIEARRL